MDKKQFNVNLGRALYELRTEFKITQEELAERAGLSRNYVSDVELGKKSVTVYTLHCILSAVGVLLEEFFRKV